MWGERGREETCQTEDDTVEMPTLTGIQHDTDWAAEDTEAASGAGATQHLWEESWDDDDTTDDFSTQLK